MKRLAGHKWIAALVAALVALAVGVSVSLANSGPSQGTVNLYKDTFCPTPGAKLKKTVGTVRVFTEKGAVLIAVHMRGAEPGNYHLDLYDSGCLEIATLLGHFKVGASGAGDEQIVGFASGGQSFYVRAHNEDTGNSAGTVLLKTGGNP
jgi:hypothetical protein